MFDWTSGINCATVKVRAAVYTSDMFTVKFPGSRLKIGLFKMAYCWPLGKRTVAQVQHGRSDAGP